MWLAVKNRTVADVHTRRRFGGTFSPFGTLAKRRGGCAVIRVLVFKRGFLRVRKRRGGCAVIRGNINS
jgi:hypothetical protein